MRLLALAVVLVAAPAGATLPLRAVVRGGEIAEVDVVTPKGTTHATFASLSRTKLDPGPVTIRATAPGDRRGVEIPECSHRGAVTIDGTRYAPSDGPFVVRLSPRETPHTIEIELRASEYERRVVCGDPIRAGALTETRDGLRTIDFASPREDVLRGGGRAVVYVPPGHDASKPAALLVGVHPWNGDAWTYAAYAELLAAARAHDVVLLMPSGLGNSLYTEHAENEVMRAIAAAEREVAIDPRRVSIWGASMGGQGATTIGLHRPDRFAFIASYFGDAKFDLASYVRSILPTEEAAHRVNPIDVIDNARWVPIWLIHGDADRTSNVHESDALAASLRMHGYAVRYDRPSGRGHEGLLVAEHIADVVARAADARVPEHPAHVTFRSVRPSDDRAYGVRILRSGNGDAFVDVEQIRGRVVVHAASGVRAIVLEPGALGAARGAPVDLEGLFGVEVRFE
ncbi:MAG TPA: prolyl oligopeptidase family serine peptidase [Polyangiaceae bacterium]|jgi:enterochelin esterase-like enzyme